MNNLFCWLLKYISVDVKIQIPIVKSIFLIQNRRTIEMLTKTILANDFLQIFKIIKTKYHTVVVRSNNKIIVRPY